MTVSVILPTFNERENIARLMPAVRAALRDAEIIVVDDDSPDGTGSVVAGLAQSDARVRLIERKERGLAGAIQRGIAEAQAQMVLWMDCDLSMPAETLPRLREAIEAGADIAIGSRYAPGGRDARGQWLAVAFSAGINLAARLLLGGPVRDYTTGFVAARKSVLEQLPLRGDYGEYCIDFLARAGRRGFRIDEVAYFCRPRAFGESKTAQSFTGFLRRGWPYVKTLVRLAWRRHP